MATDNNMPIDERYQYLRRMQPRYQRANRQEKKLLLDEMQIYTGLHRKSLIRRLNRDLRRKARGREREPTYGPDVDEALVVIWEAFDYICPERFTPSLVSMARCLARHRELELGPHLEAQLGQISVSTVRRHLPPNPLVHRRRKQPAPENRHQREIPAYRIDRDIAEPGHLELDLVHHCGGATTGEYVYTLQVIDVATGWSGRRAILGRSYVVVADALRQIFSHLPFPVREIHPDNGGEFLNAHLLHFLAREYPDACPSRSRAGQPNDNRPVEEKNHTLVRYFLGDRRLDTVQQTRYLNTLYVQLGDFYNFFQPVMKQIDKYWVPATAERPAYLKRVHDTPQTPLNRLCDLYETLPPPVAALLDRRATLNPLQLRRTIYQGLDHLFAYPNATPGEVQNVYETLADPDFFPEAQAALRAGDTGDPLNPGLPPVPPASTATTNPAPSRKEEAVLR